MSKITPPGSENSNGAKSHLHRFKEFFGLNASMMAMIMMVIFIGLGEKMAERFLPIYLIALGGSNLAIGFLNGLQNLLGALYSYPGGWLSDRIGHKKALIVFTLIAMAGYGIVILFPVWQAVLIGAFFFIAWTAVTLPAVMSLVARTVSKDKRAMGVTVHSFVRRIPMAAGPVLGGLLIAGFGTVAGIKLAFTGALILGLASILVQWFLMADGAPNNSAAAAASKSLKNFHPALRNLLISDILIRFAEQIPYAFVVVWVMEKLPFPFTAFHFGILTAIEMVTAMLIYIPVAYLADRTSKKPFVVITFVFFTAFPVLLPYCRSFYLLVVAFIIRGLKEFGEPTRKALIMDLAPEDAKAWTFGTYYLLRDTIVSVAAFGGAFLWNISPEFNFLVAALCGLAGTIWFALFGRDLKGLPRKENQLGG